MSSRKNILFLTNRVPYPPDKGDKIRTFHQLDRLAQSHNVYLACFVESRTELDRARSLHRWCAGVATVQWTRRGAVIRGCWSWLRGGSLTCGAYSDRRMRDRVRQWARQIDFDVAVAFASNMAAYALGVPAARRVLDLCDVDSEKWADYGRRARFPISAVYRDEGRRLRAYEEFCIEQFDATILINERERAVLDPQRRCPTLHVVPNGTELCPPEFKRASSCGPVLGFFGVMSYRPNVEGVRWFVRHAWPEITRRIPEAKLLLVGREPGRAIRRMASVPGVEVIGEVKDVRPYLERCRVVIAPLHMARGMQNKVLEAMAARRPVVATSAVAAGLRVLPGHNILIADEPGAFAERVLELCGFDALCDKMGDAGFRCAATFYSWAETLDRYKQIVLGETVDAGDGSYGLRRNQPTGESWSARRRSPNRPSDRRSPQTIRA